MQPLRTLSLWMDQLDEPLCARPALREDLDADVCIIGAGYTGLWTAYYLKRQAPQLNIAVSTPTSPASAPRGATAAG